MLHEMFTESIIYQLITLLSLSWLYVIVLILLQSTKEFVLCNH